MDFQAHICLFLSYVTVIQLDIENHATIRDPDEVRGTCNLSGRCSACIRPSCTALSFITVFHSQRNLLQQGTVSPSQSMRKEKLREACTRSQSKQAGEQGGKTQLM